jgi:hypothetical protein
MIVQNDPLQILLPKLAWREVEKVTRVTFRQLRWREVLPANPGGGKSLASTHGRITTTAGSAANDFPPAGLAEGYFPPPGLAGRHVSLFPLPARPVLAIKFGEGHFEQLHSIEGYICKKIPISLPFYSPG